MGLIVHAEHRAIEDHECGGLPVERDVLAELVVGPLEETADESHHRTRATFGKSAGHVYGSLLGDADIDKLFSGFLTAGLVESENTRSAGRDGHHLFILLHHGEHLLSEDLAVVGGFLFGSFGMQGSSGLRVERTGIVECLFVLLRHLQAHAFFGVDVYHYGVVDVFHRFEHLDKAVQVIAMFHIAVGIAHGAEEIRFSLAIGVAEKPEVGVYAAVVFGDAHLVVVDHNDEVRAECRSIVEAFEGDSAAERTIADHGNYVFLITLEVTGLGNSGREGNG